MDKTVCAKINLSCVSICVDFNSFASVMLLLNDALWSIACVYFIFFVFFLFCRSEHYQFIFAFFCTWDIGNIGTTSTTTWTKDCACTWDWCNVFLLIQYSQHEIMRVVYARQLISSSEFFVVVVLVFLFVFFFFFIKYFNIKRRSDYNYGVDKDNKICSGRQMHTFT